MSAETVNSTTKAATREEQIELMATPDELKELRLLRRLRTLEPADYEAQYFDNKRAPRGDAYRKMGNPSTL